MDISYKSDVTMREPELVLTEFLTIDGEEYINVSVLSEI